MGTLRWTGPLFAVMGLVAVTASPVAAAAVISASPVQPGESSQTFITVGSSQAPTIVTAAPPGLVATVSSPVEESPASWAFTMTIAAAADISPGTYSFPMTVTVSAGSVAWLVAVEVQPQTATTTTTSTTSPPATTAPPTTSGTTTTTSTTTTTTSTTTSTTSTTTTTVAPTTVAPSTVTTTTTSTTTTTTPTTVAPTTVTTTAGAAAAAPATGLGPPGAALDPSNELPLNVVLPVAGGALVLLGTALVGFRRRRVTPGSEGTFGE